jgi:hypothetical protein
MENSDSDQHQNKSLEALKNKKGAEIRATPHHLYFIIDHNQQWHQTNMFWYVNRIGQRKEY